MTMRDPGCPDCVKITSGDCGKHGPVTWPAGGMTGTYPPPTLYRVNDWVRFYFNGHPVIGVVLYIVPADWRGVKLLTDIGEVYADAVLEVRHG
jgi:hypothetical protein